MSNDTVVMFAGEWIDDMSRERLIEVINELAAENERLRVRADSYREHLDVGSYLRSGNS